MQLLVGGEFAAIRGVVLVVQLVSHHLGPQLGRYARPLERLNDGFPERMEAALAGRPVLAHGFQVAAERLGDPIPGAVLGIGFGGREQPLCICRP
ncbi:hypothetical protein D3C75_920210 [compost metagenome]